MKVASKSAQRTEGPDLLHLHTGHPLENEGGLVRGCVPRDVGFCARVVLGGAGKDFGHGGRGASHKPSWMRGSRGGTTVACVSKNTTASCGARSAGVLEDDAGRPETDSSGAG